jgi:pimeloyl-ACP methyl ester carboxylesterase
MWITLLIIALLLALAARSGPVQPPASSGISRLERVELGGVRQWISIRGADTRAPVLLFLHGGPGSANIAKLRLQVPELERHFVVVNWDQAGAGKSASMGFDYGRLSIEQMVSDAHELVTILRARFGVEKIYLMGFSWGTVIGLELAARYPQDFYAYIAVSQVVALAEGERLSLDYAREAARQAGNEKAIAKLAGIDPAYRSDDWFHQLVTERNWLLHFGGVYHTTNSYNHEIRMLLQAPEYSFFDFCLWPLASSRSLKQLWSEIMKVDFSTAVQELHVPVYFFAGRYDYNTPTQLVERYSLRLRDSAGKQLIWFENSAHDIFFDEPDRVVAETLAILEAQR